MVEAASAERGRRVAEERLGRTVALPQVMNWEATALRSEIVTFESIISVKDKELALLRQKLVESNKLLESARKQINALDRPGREENEEPLVDGSSLLESFQQTSKSKQRSILNRLERVLEAKTLDQLSRSVDRLISTETKYSELVKAICIRDRVDINKVTHNEILRSIRSGDSLEPSIKDEIKKRSGLAWTWSGRPPHLSS
jgi:hypothetical protein